MLRKEQPAAAVASRKTRETANQIAMLLATRAPQAGHAREGVTTSSAAEPYARLRRTNGSAMFAELSDVRCYYELLGSGDPILLIPGVGRTCRHWDDLSCELSKSFSLILFDNRGLGRSVAKRPAQSLGDLAVDLVELLDHLQLERAHVIGLSFGGLLAQQFALDHPSRLDRLVLVSCGNRFSPYLTGVARLLGQALRHFPPELFRRTIELLGTSPQYFDAHAEEIERDIASQCTTGVPRRAIGAQLRCLGCRDIASDREYRITAPTLVIAGDRDVLIPACYARDMARQIPGSEFLLVPDCGHNPFVEKPDDVLPRLTAFLQTRSRAEMDARIREETQLAMEESV
jgi:pimeloyl-ACP methyl ester carboxylesterase